MESINELPDGWIHNPGMPYDHQQYADGFSMIYKFKVLLLVHSKIESLFDPVNIVQLFPGEQLHLDLFSRHVV